MKRTLMILALVLSFGTVFAQTPAPAPASKAPNPAIQADQKALKADQAKLKSDKDAAKADKANPKPTGRRATRMR